MKRALPSRSARLALWLAFALLLLASAGARLLTFERFLPYMDYADESNMYLLARHQRGIESVPVLPEFLAGYPPIYPWINTLIQQAVEASGANPWRLAHRYIYALRLAAVCAGILTTALAISTGGQLAGPAAGWFAGLAWGLSPTLTRTNNSAIPDPFVFLFCAAALDMALRAWRSPQRAPLWTLGSLLACIAAIYTKYPAVVILLPWFAVTVHCTRRAPRRMAPWLAVQGVVAAGTAVYLVFGYGALDLRNHEASRVMAGLETGATLMNLLDPARNLGNWADAIEPVGMGAFLGITALAAAAYSHNRRRGGRVLPLGWAGALLLYCLLGVMLVSTYLRAGGSSRHLLPYSLALMALWGAGIAQIRWAMPPRAADAAAVGLAALMILVFGGGQLAQIRHYSLPHMHHVLWRWTDENLPNDGKILMKADSSLRAVWNRPWSGYDGATAFDWWFEEDLTANTPAEYAGRGMAYFAVDAQDLRREGFITSEERAFIVQLTPLKTIPASPGVVGDAVYFYRILSPQVETDVTFGEQISLTGYDFAREGASATFRPYWRRADGQPPAANYSMFVHLYPPARDEVLTQYDGAPAGRPTLLWDDPNELYIGPSVSLALPDETSKYRLAVGLYDYLTTQRLTLGGGGDYYEIAVK